MMILTQLWSVFERCNTIYYHTCLHLCLLQFWFYFSIYLFFKFFMVLNWMVKMVVYIYFLDQFQGQVVTFLLMLRLQSFQAIWTYGFNLRLFGLMILLRILDGVLVCRTRFDKKNNMYMMIVMCLLEIIYVRLIFDKIVMILNNKLVTKTLTKLLKIQKIK